MIKIVMDANQFVSVILNKQGKPAKIFEMVVAQKVKLAISEEIIAEVKRVLQYPKLQKLHKQTPKRIDKLIGEFINFAYFTYGRWHISAIKDDPTDDKYLECAVEASADFIISGDHHLTDLKNFQGINIITPAEFLEILSA